VKSRWKYEMRKCLKRFMQMRESVERERVCERERGGGREIEKGKERERESDES